MSLLLLIPLDHASCWLGAFWGSCVRTVGVILASLCLSRGTQEICGPSTLHFTFNRELFLFKICLREIF